jgi:hypothetical protein
MPTPEWGDSCRRRKARTAAKFRQKYSFNKGKLLKLIGMALPLLAICVFPLFILLDRAATHELKTTRSIYLACAGVVEEVDATPLKS